MKDKLVMKSDDYGIALFKNGQGRFYHKNGNDPHSLFLFLEDSFPNGFEYENGGEMTEEESESFC